MLVPAPTPDALPFSSVHHGIHLQHSFDVAPSDGSRYVLLLHGWMGTSGDMVPLALELVRAGYHVLSADLPYHGNSCATRSQSPQQAAAQLLLSVTSVLGHKTVTEQVPLSIIGYSMGGRLALEMYALCVQQSHGPQTRLSIGSLILLSCAPPIAPSAPHSVAEGCVLSVRRAAVALRQQKTPDEFRHWLVHKWYAAPMWGSLSSAPAFKTLVESRVATFHQCGAWAEATEKLCRAHMTGLSALATADVQVLYICGEADSKYVSFAQDIQSLYHAANTYTISSAGHNVLLHAFQTVCDRILSFLAGRNSLVKPLTFSVTALSTRLYELPLHSPMVVSGVRVSSRHGLLVKLTATDGSAGVGDVCPLPGLHAESVQDCMTEVSAFARALSESAPSFAVGDFSLYTARKLLASLSPVTRSGVECALLHMAANVSGVSIRTAALRSVSVEQERGGNIAGVVLVSGVVPRRPLGCEAVDMTLLPFDTVKLKVGTRNSSEEEARDITHAASACAAAGKVLRLDANRSWTVKQYEAVLSALSPAAMTTIEYVEEPVRTPSELMLAARGELRVAADETLVEYFSNEGDRAAKQVVEQLIEAVVVKIPVLGGMQPLRTLLNSAPTARIVLSAVFESGVGIAWAAALAAVADNVRGQATVHGLGTHAHLGNDVLTPGFTKACTTHGGAQIDLVKCQEFMNRVAQGSGFEPLWHLASK